MRVKKAITHEELLDVYRLRYKVYCLERGYERMEDCPNGLETDEYDPYSIHFIAYVGALPVGTVRLILPNPLGFPVERFCNVNVASIYPDTRRFAEISRLAVSSEVAKECLTERSRITLALLKCLHLTARELNVGYFLSAMSTALERLLSRCGMRFKKAGLPVDYHGIRTPYYALCEEMEKELFQRRKDIFELFFPSFASSFDDLPEGRRTALVPG
jgi:N-acyl-L-homoserine lactone synthetase